MKERSYSTAEICEMFNISKSTLFRWEREGLLPSIPRDISGQRKYGPEHLRLISERQKEKLGRRFEQIAEDGDEESYWEISEALSLNKFLEGDSTGLFELAEHPRVSAETQVQLLRIALDHYQPGDPVFQEIIRIIHEQNQVANLVLE